MTLKIKLSIFKNRLISQLVETCLLGYENEVMIRVQSEDTYGTSLPSLPHVEILRAVYHFLWVAFTPFLERRNNTENLSQSTCLT